MTQQFFSTVYFKYKPCFNFTCSF